MEGLKLPISTSETPEISGAILNFADYLLQLSLFETARCNLCIPLVTAEAILYTRHRFGLRGIRQDAHAAKPKFLFRRIKTLVAGQ